MRRATVCVCVACCTMPAPLSRRRPLEVVVVNSHL
eukprot:COSAG05_NODE_12244_length_475_cov_1.311170_2_plen_34_part_01